MRFLATSAFWWMLVGAIIILLYLLKLKRTRYVVPSVMLWQRALDELEANAPFRRLRRNLLLLLQLLVVAALAFALARPLLQTRTPATGNTIIVLDSTASMAATDEDGNTRLDRARRIAREIVGGLGGDDRAAIVESSSRVTLRSGLVSDRAALLDAIDQVEGTDAAGNLTDALRLAEQMARSETNSSIVIISDGGGSGPGGSGRDSSSAPAENAPSEPESSGQTAVSFVRVGTRKDNVGIIAMNARGVPGRNQQIFASIANFADSGRSFGAELHIAGRLIDARNVEIPANDRAAVVFDVLPTGGGLASLKIDLSDDLSADNVAWCFVPSSRLIRAGVASNNPFVLGALAVNSTLDARRAEAASPAAVSAFDCLVSDGQIPQGFLESGRPLLLINASDAAGLCKSAGLLERPQVGSARSHPINAYLSFADLNLERATRLEPAPWLVPILTTSTGEGLIWAGDDGRRRVVLIGFDLNSSDLPLQVEFPILMANVVSWLSGYDPGAAGRVIRPGQTTFIPTTGSNATVTRPDGQTEDVRTLDTRSDGSVVYANTLRTGEYEIAGGDAFAVTLLTESESDTAPRDRIRMQSGDVLSHQQTYTSEHEIWRWMAAAALLLLGAEWWTFHRRAV